MISEAEIKETKKSSAPAEYDILSKWRVFKPKIDPKVCQKNYNCVVFCPNNAVSVSKSKNGYPSIDYSLCTGCLICLRECPANAITEERESR